MRFVGGVILAMVASYQCPDLVSQPDRRAAHELPGSLDPDQKTDDHRHRDGPRRASLVGMEHQAHSGDRAG